MIIKIKIPKVNALVSEEDMANYIYDALTCWRYNQMFGKDMMEVNFSDMQITIGGTTWGNTEEPK